MNPLIAPANSFEKLSSPLPGLEKLKANPTSADLARQCEENLKLIQTLREGLPPAEQLLIESAGIIVSFCHSGHSRSGEPPIHYTHHLYQVAKRITDNYVESGLVFASPEGTPISEKTVAITVALLHDSMEDIVKTFPALSDPKIAFPTVERFIRSQLELVANPETIDRICQSVQKLSIKNDGDFIDSQYLAEVSVDPICRQVKWADVDHNMETMPDVFPLSGSIHFAAQVSELMTNSPYNEKYLHQVCISAKRSSGKIDPENFERNALGKAYARLYHFEGHEGLDRLEHFYQDLLTIQMSSPEVDIFPKQYSPSKMQQILEEQIKNIAEVRVYLSTKDEVTY